MRSVQPAQGVSNAPVDRPADPTDPEAITRVLLEKSPLLVYVVDLDYRVVLFNRALREASGCDTSDCPDVDALLRHFYPDERYRTVVSAIHDGWRKNEHIRGAELVVHSKDGTQRTISWSTSRLKIARGAASGYIAMGVDVTTRRSLEQWVSLLQRSLQHLTEGVVLTDPAGRILAWNEGAHRLVGHQEGQVQGRSFSDLYLRQEREIISRSVERAIEAEGRYEGEVELERADASTTILGLRQFRIDGEGGAPLARLIVLSEPPGGEGMVALDTGSQAEISRLQALVRDQARMIDDRDGRIAARERAIDELRALAEEVTQGAAAELKAALEDSERRARHAEAQVMDLDTALAREHQSLEAVRAELARSTGDAATRAEGRAHELEERLAELGLRLLEAESTLDVRAAELGGAQAEVAALQERVALERSALNAAMESARLGAESALDTLRRDAHQGREEAVQALRQEMMQLVENAEGRLDVERLRALAAEAQATDAGARITLLEKQVEDAAEDRRLREERTVEERARMENSHREELALVAERAALERRNLEDQLHKDILAAEERAELERSHLQGKIEQQRGEWQDAASIARAEAESTFRLRVDALQTQLSKTPPLQAHLAPVEEAVVVADTEGRILGWSAGAATIAGKAASEAIGQVLHRDVLSIAGVPWKTVFGKVMVGGRFEQDVTVQGQSGGRSVRLLVSLVKNAQGKAVGITERLISPTLEVPPATHGAAALGTLVRPGLTALAGKVDALVAQVPRAGAQVRDLCEIARLVDRAAPAADLEPAMRRVDLRNLHRNSEGDYASLDAAIRQVRAQVRDLELLASWVGPSPDDLRWNELVERCACAIEASSSLRFFRRYGEVGTFSGRADTALAALLQILAGASVSAESPSLVTSVEAGRLVLEVNGLQPPSSPQLLRHLVEVLGGEVEWSRDGGAARTLIRVPAQPLPPAPVSEPAPAPSVPIPPPPPVPERLAEPSPLMMGGVEERSGEESGVVPIHSGVVVVVDDESRELLAMAGEDSWAGPLGGGGPAAEFASPPGTVSPAAAEPAPTPPPGPPDPTLAAHSRRPSADVVTLETPVFPPVPVLPPLSMTASQPVLTPLPPLDGGGGSTPKYVIDDADADDLELIDELEEVFTRPVVSPSLLESAREMEDFARQDWDELDDLVEGAAADDAIEGAEADDVGVAEEDEGEQGVTVGATSPEPLIPLGLDDDATRPYQVPAELASTDSDGAMGRAMAGKVHGKKKKKR